MGKVIAPYITVDPRTRFGKPVIKGTRVTVERVLAEIAGGLTVQEVMHEYRLTRRQVRAAIEYAQHMLGEERHVFLVAPNLLRFRS